MSSRHNREAVPRALFAWLGFLSILFSGLLPADGEESAPAGAVGLRELTVLALQNDPGLVALRHNIPVEEAKKRAAVQWRDPELRFGISRDANIQLDDPYTRSGTSTETFTTRGNSTESGGLNGNATGRETTSGTRTTSFTEQVIPGANSDRVIRTETERLQTQTSSRDTDNRGTTNRSGSDSEVFRSRTDENVFHGRDRLARDQTASVKVRFWLPKPAEMKALIDQAARRVEMANYQITAAERQVILEVREQYEQLQFLSRKLAVSKSQISIIEKHVEREQKLLNSGGAFTLDQLSFEDLKIPGLELAVDAAEMELEAAKRALAARVGLADGSRIRVDDNLLRSGISLRDTDLDYLTLMAFAHRGEVGILQHEQAIAESELHLVKTKRIPWFSFLEAAYANDSTGGQHTNDNYGVQVGVILPLFSEIAKEEDVAEARLQSYYAMLEANQKSIANEVAEAFKSVNDATRHRARTNDAVARHSEKMARRAEDLEASENLAAKEQLRYDTEMQQHKLREYQLSADRLYNQSLIRLEKALGADLDRVFRVEYETFGAVQSTPSKPRSRPGVRGPEATPAPIRATPVPVPEASVRGSQGGEPRSKKGGLFRFLKQQNGKE